MENLKLHRPIAFIDIETTGVDPYSDRIVEISVLKVFPDGKEDFRSARINPGIHIPEDATKIHGISDSDVVDQPIFKQYSKSLYEYLKECDFGGFGIKRFDLPLLVVEFKRAGINFSLKGKCILDAMIIFHKMNPRDLKAAYKFYCNAEMEQVHTSEADARASMAVLDAQLSAHTDLPKDVDGLHNFCYPLEVNWVDSEGKFIWSGEDINFGFGRYKGKNLKDIARDDPDYLRWLSNAEFDETVRIIAKNALMGKFPNLQDYQT